MTTQKFYKKFNKFIDIIHLAIIKAVKEENHNLNVSGSPSLIYHEEKGNYIKLIEVDGIHRNTFGFVDVQNGDIFCCSRCGHPADNASGNIFDKDNGESALDKREIKRTY